jgi:general secretion pathway protein H
MRRRGSHGGGFTLIEILVVLVIIGLISGLAVRGLRSLAKSDLRHSTAQLSGAIRFLFDRASTTGQYHRLVIDVTEGRYWAEVSDSKFFIPRDPETETWRQKRAEIEAALDDEERQKAEDRGDVASGNDSTSSDGTSSSTSGGSSSSSSGNASSGRSLGGGSSSPLGGTSDDDSKVKVQDFRPKRVRFGAFQSSTLKPVQMKHTHVMDVYTPRMDEPVTEGRAYIYFFPLGQSEAAIIHLSDEDGENIYSLVVHPITGRVQTFREYVKPPYDDRMDDEGTAVVQ